MNWPACFTCHTCLDFFLFFGCVRSEESLVFLGKRTRIYAVNHQLEQTAHFAFFIVLFLRRDFDRGKKICTEIEMQF